MISGQVRLARFGVAGSLRDRFDPRRNHLGSLRLGLALTVALTHAMTIGFGRQPYIGRATFGDLAVDAFFVLSGFLLAGSYLRLGSLRSYVWHRFLRIMPAFWVCLLVTAFVLTPLIARLQGRAAFSVVTGEQSAIRYVLVNSALSIRQFGIAGLPQSVPIPDVLDGSLWTLVYEAVCYATIIGLGMVGALKRRPFITLIVVLLLWAATALNSAGFEVVHQERLLRFTFMFLIGSVMFLYAGRIPVRGALACGSFALVVAGLVCLPDYRALAGPAFGYLFLWAAVAHPPRSAPKADFSYGLYVYHWPILQVLTVAGLTGIGEPAFVAVGLSLAFAAAVVSWILVERPALNLKDSFTRPPNRPTPPGHPTIRLSAVEPAGEIHP